MNGQLVLEAYHSRFLHIHERMEEIACYPSSDQPLPLELESRFLTNEMRMAVVEVTSWRIEVKSFLVGFFAEFKLKLREALHSHLNGHASKFTVSYQLRFLSSSPARRSFLLGMSKSRLLKNRCDSIGSSLRASSIMACKREADQCTVRFCSESTRRLTDATQSFRPAQCL